MSAAAVAARAIAVIALAKALEGASLGDRDPQVLADVEAILAEIARIAHPGGV